MKLLHKTSLQLFFLTVTTLSIIGSLLYFWMQQQISAEIYEQLEFEIAQIKSELAAGRTVAFPLVDIHRVASHTTPKVLFGDTLIFDHVQQVPEEYYYLKKIENVGKEVYLISTMTAYIGWKQYANMILTAFIGITFLLCGFGLMINYYTNKRTWLPFFSNLELLRKFSVKSNDPVSWHSSNITEFITLQCTLTEMTERSRREYLSLREFTENASHEIQTPLSIMRSSLERLSQYEVDQTMAAAIVDAKSALDRLSKVNKKLLMLAKLENNYYAEKQLVNLSLVLREKISLMEDLFIQKSIQLSVLSDDDIIVNTDGYLLDTLIFNMLSNMLLHAPSEGIACVEVRPSYMAFKNNGMPLLFSSERIFERFKKGSTDAKSNGLGLSIVYQICEINEWTICYDYIDGYHRFKIEF